MYHILSAMEFSILWIIAFIIVNDEFSGTPVIVLDSLLMGSSFIKLMFTLWILMHLFALAVFHKNLQRLERLYVVSSLLIPLAVTIVLLVIIGCSTAIFHCKLVIHHNTNKLTKDINKIK